jgi:hypothetical protein
VSLRLAVVLASIAAIGCGAKTGLRAPDAGLDAGRDAGPPVDVGVDAFVPAAACIEVPPMEPPSVLDVDFVARIQEADVYFLVDVTGSMGGEIGEIQRGIEATIAPGIVAAIPNVRLSLGRFADYAAEGFGSNGDDVFRLIRASSADLAAFGVATHDLTLQSGGDPPEAYVPALFFSARGVGAADWVPASSCPAGTVGYPCFARRGARIVLLFTDAEAHGGPSGANPYAGIVPRPPTYDEAVAALRGIGARVIGIFSGTPEDGHGLDDVTALARDTGAVTSDGTPLVFEIGGDGAGLDRSVVDAVQRLVTDVPIAIDLVVEDVPGDAVDATTFVRSVVTNGAVPADGAIDRGDHFEAVRPGTQVSFRILLQNDVLPRQAREQRFRLRVILRGDGVTELDAREYDVVVPAIDGTGCAL